MANIEGKTCETARKRFETIGQIIHRAEKLGIMYPTRIPRVTLMMDLDYVLTDSQLNKLSSFSDKDFIHDVMGIQAHMNRVTCNLNNMFIPRCWGN